VYSSKNNKRLCKLTEYLGKEHDLQMFYEYMVQHFAGLSCTYEPFFKLKIKKLRKKILAIYPKLTNFSHMEMTIFRIFIEVLNLVIDKILHF